MWPFYRFTAAYVGRQLGIAAQLTTGRSFDQFAGGEIDAAFICGLPYARLAAQRPSPVTLLAAPVLRDERCRNRPIYFSDVIARRDSPYQSFADLRGRRWAYNEADSQSGYGVIRHHLAQMGESMAYFSETVASGAHRHSISMVCAGAVDAAAIDCQLLALMLRRQPEIARQLRVIDTLGPSTIQPVAAASHLPASLQAEIQTILLALADDPAAAEALAYAGIRCFTAVTDQDYDDIRLMSGVSERFAD